MFVRCLIVLLYCLGESVCPGEDHQIDVTEVSADVLIVGGTESGCAAAVQAARMGVKSIVLVNDTSWLGGQFSSEALVAIDENRGPAGYDHTVPFPRNGSFLEIIDLIEQLNNRKYGASRPGNTRVITTCRPADAAEVFQEWLQPYVASGQLKIVDNQFPIAAFRTGDRLNGMMFEPAMVTDNDNGDQVKSKLIVRAAITIDASDWGDAIKLAGADYEFGPDLHDKYGEPLAPIDRSSYPVTDMNPVTYNLVIHETDRYEPIPAPENYNPENYRHHNWPRDPLWLYESRRIIDHYNLPDVTHPDVLLLCFPAIDYPLDVLPAGVAAALEATEQGASAKNIVQLSRTQREIIFRDAKLYSLGFLHYLQTEVHSAMPDQEHSFRRFELTDEFKTSDRLPPKPYIRESLRLRAMYMMRQQDTMGYRGNARRYSQVMYHDALGAWQFEYDFHPTRRVFLDDDNPTGPWKCDFRPGRTWGPPYSGLSTFPLRSLIPAKLDGLLGCQKNLGYSSIVSSALRLHDQSMAIGTAAGATAAFCIRHQMDARAIPVNRERLVALQRSLVEECDESCRHILWPFPDLKPDHAAFVAANLLAVTGSLPLDPRRPELNPDVPATIDWCNEVKQISLAQRNTVGDIDIPLIEGMTRGEFLIKWWKAIESLSMKSFHSRSGKVTSPADSDGDGIDDIEDALPFDPAPNSWSHISVPADRDGVPDSLAGKPVDGVIRFNFAGPGVTDIDGFRKESGRKFETESGFGWRRDISSNHRKREQISGDYRDTFLFTRSHDTWDFAARNTRWRVTVCVGDSGHEQSGQNVTVEGQPLVRNETTAAGEWLERSMIVSVSDGMLTLEIGLAGSTTNTCLNWIEIVPVDEP
ncbi:MAG: FAD-dependent oxidoreductase [Planctomycetaceae bacterium]